MDKAYIEAGDEVVVHFAHQEPIRGHVVYMPGGPGDSWIVRRGDDKVVYIQQFDYIERV